MTTDTSWFSELGLGIFLHWDHSSARGWEISWQMVGGVEGQYPPREPVGCEEYFANAYLFNPNSFDAGEWARTIADSGARYAVFTTKHHGGFAMWNTDLSEYSIAKSSPFGRDVVAELVPALRAAGLRVGLYFSIVDWFSPLYPRFTDAAVCKPYRIGRYPRQPETWDAYRSFLLGQLTELLTRFGPIDLIWLDGEFEHTPDEWGFGEIREHIRSLQPRCLVNDRCKGFGDFITPEQQLPEIPPAGLWEQCLTLNESWSYVPSDDAWKSPSEIIATLIETRTAGGNLLLGIGPDGTGAIPPEASARLAAVGAWIRANGESISGVGAGLRPWQCRLPTASRCTEQGQRLYVYLTMDPGPVLRLRDLPVSRVRAVSLLGEGRALDYTASASLPEVHRQSPDPTGEVAISRPDRWPELVGVVAIDIAPTS